MYKTDVKILWRGFKRLVLALLTATTFVASVYGLITVAVSTGYLAVLRLIGSLAASVIAGLLLYTLGL